MAGLCLGVLPGTGQAETRTYLNLTHLLPASLAGSFGPATSFPSRIVVRGLSGRITNVKVTIIGYGSAAPDDTDLALMKGTGPKVMLMSDTCGESYIESDNWTFDDAAPTFLSNNGPCANYQSAAFRPSNYLGGPPEPDDFSPDGGPPPPYRNALSSFKGTSPNGTWKLFADDDNAFAGLGFDIPAWALQLKISHRR